MTVETTSKATTARLLPGSVKETWILAAVGDPTATMRLALAPGAALFRAYDGVRAEPSGQVVLTAPAAVISIARGKAVPDRTRSNALAGPRTGWKPAGNAIATSPDGSFVAEMMELLAVRRHAPQWLWEAIEQASADLRKGGKFRSFYDALLERGVATSPTVGQWGTCDFHEWRYRSSARIVDEYVAKLFAIRGIPTRAVKEASFSAPSNLAQMCDTVAPGAYYVSVRQSKVSRSGDRVGLDVELEAGHVPPADWIPESKRAAARFIIAPPPGSSGRSTLVVPSGQRSGVTKLHFTLPDSKGQAHITVLDDRKRRYDLPIDLG